MISCALRVCDVARESVRLFSLTVSNASLIAITSAVYIDMCCGILCCFLSYSLGIQMAMHVSCVAFFDPSVCGQNMSVLPSYLSSCVFLYSLKFGNIPMANTHEEEYKED